MRISLKCEKCGHVYVNDSDKELSLEIDFKDKKINYLCRHPDCGHDNVLDLNGWKQVQGKSPLPKIGIMR